MPSLGWVFFEFFTDWRSSDGGRETLYEITLHNFRHLLEKRERAAGILAVIRASWGDHGLHNVVGQFWEMS
ncbi:hypothetical protein [Pseudomonas chlororaphis]|uniref:hypothetical protein n=1 Tax=Pseudomonas chlororaphis TaxID=587753 RepID=UPI002D796DCD|nr:hypothetical protein [Pseudomonas chlororaphis]